MSKSLKQRSIHSGGWILGGHLLSQSLRLVSNLILTRLLVPEMFGLMAIVSVFMMGIAMFSDVGLQQNIVQSKRGEEQSYLDTAWTIQIIRGVFIFLVAVILSTSLYYLGKSGFLGSNTVYSNPQLPFLLMLMSVSALISGFNSINLLLLNRRLMMSKVVIIDIFCQVIALISMVVLAWYWREAWALVVGGIISSLLKMLLSHKKSLGVQNKLHWDKSCVHEIVHFGKWIFISSILGFLLAQGDRLLLGSWISPEQLGVYSVAFFLSMALKDALKKVIANVFYPMLSEVVRTRPEEIKRVYYEIRSKVDIITMVFAGVMASTGHIVVDILYDERYHEAGQMLEILSFSMIFVGYSMAGMCLMAMGNSKSQTWLIFTAMLFLYISLPVAYHYYGLYGAIWMFAFNYLIDIPSTFYMMKKYDLLDIKKEFKMLPLLFISYGIGKYLLILI